MIVLLVWGCLVPDGCERGRKGNRKLVDDRTKEMGVWSSYDDKGVSTGQRMGVCVDFWGFFFSLYFPSFLRLSDEHFILSFSPSCISLFLFLGDEDDAAMKADGVMCDGWLLLVVWLYRRRVGDGRVRRSVCVYLSSVFLLAVS
jgi:hypothetical protein